MNLIRNSIAGTIVAAALICSSSLASAQIIGVGTHFGQKRDYIQYLIPWAKRSPITSIRDEIYWKDIERTEGNLTMEGRAAFSLMNIRKAAEAGLTPLIILSYGNPIYDLGSQPSSARGRAGFARYATFIYHHTKDLNPIFEIWNEWNIGSGTNPKVKFGSAEDYVELVRATSTALRRAGHKGLILGGALGDDYPKWQWAKKAISLGLLDDIDGISIHLYNYSNDTLKAGAAEFFERTHALHEIIVGENKTTPIFITEVGWPNHVGFKSVTPDRAATEAEILLNEVSEHPYIKGVWFYEFSDSGTNPFDKEHHFGLLDWNFSEKKISCAIRRWGSTQGGTSWIKRERFKGVSVATGISASGEQILRVWPSPKSGTVAAKFSVKPTKKSDDSRVLRETDCTIKESNSPRLLEHGFPTDVPITVTTPKGQPSPKVFIND